MSIHPTAIIDPLAEIHPSVTIGPFAVVDGPVRIRENCRIDAHAVILGRIDIGPGSQIHSHAVIGDLPQDRGFAGEESGVRIGGGCIIREGATIHRSTGPGTETVVGNRCVLMTNSHVGHNCLLGDDVILVSGALLGGHVQVGRAAIISGNGAIHQFVRIGELVMVSGLAKVVQDVPPFFMTDRNGAVVGVNSLGLRRADFTPIERAELQNAYRIIYRSGAGREAAMHSLGLSITTDPGRRLLEFMSATSRRGLASAPKTGVHT